MGLTWKSGFQGEACIKCIFMQRSNIILSGKAIRQISKHRGIALLQQGVLSIKKQPTNVGLGQQRKEDIGLSVKPIARQGMSVNPSGFHKYFFQVESS